MGWLQRQTKLKRYSIMHTKIPREWVMGWCCKQLWDLTLLESCLLHCGLFLVGFLPLPPPPDLLFPHLVEKDVPLFFIQFGQQFWINVHIPQNLLQHGKLVKQASNTRTIVAQKKLLNDERATQTSKIAPSALLRNNLEPKSRCFSWERLDFLSCSDRIPLMATKIIACVTYQQVFSRKMEQEICRRKAYKQGHLSDMNGKVAQKSWG